MNSIKISDSEVVVMCNRKMLRVLVTSMLFTTAYCGNLSLAADPVSEDGNLTASEITGCQTFNTVRVMSNTEATVTARR